MNDASTNVSMLSGQEESRPANRRIWVYAAALGLAIGWGTDHLLQAQALARAARAEESLAAENRQLQERIAARERVKPSAETVSAVRELTDLGAEFYVRPYGARLSSSFNFSDGDVAKLAAIGSLESVSLPGCGLTDYALDHLARLPQLRSLHLQGGWVTRDTLERLSQFPQLRTLAIDAAPIYDEDLSALEKLTKLSHVRLHDVPISSSGLKHIQRLPNLRELNLSGTSVSDRGVPALAALASLESLDIRKTQITAAGAAELQKLLPHCTVLHDSQPD